MTKLPFLQARPDTDTQSTDFGRPESEQTLQSSKPSADTSLQPEYEAGSGVLKKTAAALQIILDAGVTVGSDGTILQANQRALELFGYAEGEFVGANVNILLPEEQRGNYDRYMHYFGQLGVSRAMGTNRELVACKKDGSRLSIHLGLSEVTEGFGSAYVGIIRSTSDEPPKHAVDERSIFLRSISHEIRTPLNGVLGMTSLLLEMELSPEVMGCIATIEDSGMELVSIIDELIDYSRLETGNIELEQVSFNIRSITRKSLTKLIASLGNKSIELRCTFHEEVPWWVKGDPARIQQVLRSLLANAMDSTEQGSIEVRLMPAQGKGIRFEIADTGTGLHEYEVTEFFTPFTTHQRWSPGTATLSTGLGSSISKRLVALMGGTIGVHSTYGEGSTFWFEIPFESTLQPKSVVRVKHLVAPHCLLSTTGISGTVRVLTVDDNRINQIVADKMVTSLGFYSQVATSGRDALEKLETDKFDIILMDCQMPDIDGYEATRAIRTQEEGTGAHIPIIAMTANVMPGDRQECLDAGMDDYLSKPLSRSSLEAMLQAWLRDSEAAAQ